MQENKQETYRYEFRSDKRGLISYTLYLSQDRMTLLKLEPEIKDIPDWALLEYCTCENCSLESKNFRYCPVALNIVQVGENFKDTESFEPMQVTVSTPERTISSRTPIQYALGSLLGLCNAVSGCPVMRGFAPLARFHLPFATVEETVYRIVANYLLEQYCRYHRGDKPDWELDGLHRFYMEVEKVNRALCERLRGASVKDANMNAVITLDTFVKNFIYLMEDNLGKIRSLYV